MRWRDRGSPIRRGGQLAEKGCDALRNLLKDLLKQNKDIPKKQDVLFDWPEHEKSKFSARYWLSALWGSPLLQTVRAAPLLKS